MRLFSALLVAGFWLFSGCAHRLSVPANPGTGQVVSAVGVAAFLHEGLLPRTLDATYEVIRYDWLQEFHNYWRANLGPHRWTPSRDCNDFTARFYADAQWYYYGLNFQTGTKAQALALGEYTYRTKKGGLHAIIVAIADRGRGPEVVFWDPQEDIYRNGFRALSAQERKSSLFKRL